MRLTQISNKNVITIVNELNSVNTNGLLELSFSQSPQFGQWYITQVEGDYSPFLTVTSTATFSMDSLDLFADWLNDKMLNVSDGYQYDLLLTIKTYSKNSRLFCMTMKAYKGNSIEIPETIVALSSYDSSSITTPPELWNVIMECSIPADDLRNSSGSPTFLPIVSFKAPGNYMSTTLYLSSEDGGDSPSLMLKTSDTISITHPPTLVNQTNIDADLRQKVVLDYNAYYDEEVSLSELKESIRSLSSRFVSM